MVLQRPHATLLIREGNTAAQAVIKSGRDRNGISICRAHCVNARYLYDRLLEKHLAPIDTPSAAMAADIVTKTIPEPSKFLDAWGMRKTFDPNRFDELLQALFADKSKQRANASQKKTWDVCPPLMQWKKRFGILVRMACKASRSDKAMKTLCSTR